MPRSQRPQPPPLRTNDYIPIAVGTALWAVALAVLLVFYGELPAGERWWVWTCVAGVAGGLFGLLYLWLRRRFLAKRAARSSGAADETERDEQVETAAAAGRAEPSGPAGQPPHDERAHSYSPARSEWDGSS